MVSEVVAIGIGHVSVYGDAITVFIKLSRTDQFVSGAFVQVKKSNDAVLLFQSVKTFSTLHTGVKRHPFFSVKLKAIGPIPVFINVAQSFAVLQYSIVCF